MHEGISSASPNYISVHLKKIFSGIIIAAVFSTPLRAQLLDDTTRMIYGPHTTFYVLEEDILNNRERTYMPDTLLDGFHNYNFIFNGTRFYQDLGNLGSPSQMPWYLPPENPGRRVGYAIYDAFAPDPGKVKYYDTRSPYTNLHYVQGSRGQQLFNAAFSRNINPHWNMGLDFRRITSHKQIGVTQFREPQASHFAVEVHNRFFTKDQRYQLLANITHLHHENSETGGIFPEEGETRDDMFDYNLERVFLRGARGHERRINYHVYQEGSILKDKSIQVYHIFDYMKRVNWYRDENGTLNAHFYPVAVTGLINEQADYRLFQNQGGLKGRRKSFSYRAYYKMRRFSMDQHYALRVRHYSENFLGAYTAYSINDSSQVSLSGEYMPGRDYMARLHYFNKFLNAEYKRIFYSPALVEQTFTGLFYQWENNFSNTLSDNINISAEIKPFKNLRLLPSASLNFIHNYIYYDTMALPAQTGEMISIYSAGIQMNLKIGFFHLDNYSRYTHTEGPDVIRVPSMYNHTRVYLQGRIFDKALLVQAGTDLFWRSTYFADSYMPVTQQFFLNDHFPVDSYLLSDVFVNMLIKRVRVFFKLSHFNQGFGRTQGYFTTPYYSGMPRSFDFGINWRFYD